MIVKTNDFVLVEMNENELWSLTAKKWQKRLKTLYFKVCKYEWFCIFGNECKRTVQFWEQKHGKNAQNRLVSKIVKTNDFVLLEMNANDLCSFDSKNMAKTPKNA